MAGVARSLEKFNAREQLLSADLVRGQLLASRDAQNLEAGASGALDDVKMQATSGAPIYGVNKPPTFVPAGGYTVTIGAGDGFFNDPAFVGLTADDSSYLVVRWDAGDVTFANPPGANARIDVVIATPTMVDTDSQSRTVLVDPVTRAITSTPLYKTTNPVATLSVVTGVAAAVPAVPAIPAGALPLFYVYVPTGAATAARFGKCRASWRRASYPFTSLSGVVRGCGCLWDLAVDPAVASAGIAMNGLHRVVIDGEVMEFQVDLDSAVGACVVSDTANNPFGVAAGASWHTPYYLYLVGGRNKPMPCFNSANEAITNGSGCSPVTLVESLVAPDIATGKASANMTVNGQVVPPSATAYIGLGFVAAGTTRRLACIMNDTFTMFGHGTTTNRLVLTKVGGGVENAGVPLNKPTISARAKVVLLPVIAGANQPVGLIPNDAGGNAPPSFTAGIQGTTSMVTSFGAGGEFRPIAGELTWPQNSPAQTWVQGGAAADVIDIYFNGYDHRVPKFGVHVNP